jgi:hypothetical protein
MARGSNFAIAVLICLVLYYRFVMSRTNIFFVVAVPVPILFTSCIWEVRLVLYLPVTF